jgi:hypothetical protein
MSIIDQKFIENVEAGFHNMGDDAWDVPPTFMVFGHIPADTEDGEETITGGIIGHSFSEMFSDPGEIIEAIGSSLHYALSNPDVCPDPMILLKPEGDELAGKTPKIIGAGFIIETWSISPDKYAKALAAMTQEERDATREAYGGRIPITHLTNTPDEHRLVYIVDTKQYVHILDRVRGQDQANYSEPPAPLVIPGEHESNRHLIATLIATLDVILQIEATAT